MGAKLYVGNLSFDVESSELEEMFGSDDPYQTADLVDTAPLRGWALAKPDGLLPAGQPPSILTLLSTPVKQADTL